MCACKVKVQLERHADVCKMTLGVGRVWMGFVVDTGSSHSLVGRGNVCRMGLNIAIDPRHPLLSSISMSRRKRIEGGITLRMEVAPGIILEQDFGVSGTEVNLLGMDFLRDYDAIVCFSEVEDCIFLNPEREKLPVELNCRPQVSCELLNVHALALLDTGCSTTVMDISLVSEEALVDATVGRMTVHTPAGTEERQVWKMAGREVLIDGMTLTAPSIVLLEGIQQVKLGATFMRENSIILACRTLIISLGSN